MDINIKELKKDIKALGIINIEADGNLSPELLHDAVEAVKEANLNFKELAEKSRLMAASAQ